MYFNLPLHVDPYSAIFLGDSPALHGASAMCVEIQMCFASFASSILQEYCLFVDLVRGLHIFYNHG